MMARKISNTDAIMGNNSEKNKEFKRAANEAKLSESERREFSKLLHSDKEFETGDRSYDELLKLAKECKDD